MKKSAFVSICLICFAVSSGFADSDYESKLKKTEQQKKEGINIVVDDNLQREMENYLISNENVSVRDFKKMRLAGFTSDVILDRLNRKYGVTENNYQTKIKGEREKMLYKSALKVWRKWNYRGYYACKNEDENAVMQSIIKANERRSRIRELMKKNDDRHSDEMIKIHEQTIDECRFARVSLSLLSTYRSRGMREKFNNLMLRIIADDQVSYDYLYDGVSFTNNAFVLTYVDFLTDVNGRQEKLILSKEQVRLIAESLLTKEQDVFNMRNATFYSPEKDMHYDSIVIGGVAALVRLSTLLGEYKLDELNDKFINKFFQDEQVISTVRDQPLFKDFWNYLLQRPGFEKYRDA